MIKICGRYYLKVSIDELLNKYGIINNDLIFTPAAEIFPSQEAPVILNDNNKKRKIERYRWGFKTSYSKKLIINARAETIEQKKTFKDSFEKKRCIIPVNGFFEWEQQGNKKVKYKIYLQNQSIFSLAALYDNYQNEQGDIIKSFTIITTKANKKIKKIHDRMPAILNDNDISSWLDSQYDNEKKYLKSLLKPYQKNNLILEAEYHKKQMSLDFN